jgi:hypothetical protein
MTMTDESLPTGWYTSEDGLRRFWDGQQWLTPAGSAPAAATQPAAAVTSPQTSRKGPARLTATGVVMALVGFIGALIARSTAISRGDDDAFSESLTRAIAADNGVNMGDWRDVEAAYNFWPAWVLAAIGAIGVVLVVAGAIIRAAQHR